MKGKVECNQRSLQRQQKSKREIRVVGFLEWIIVYMRNNKMHVEIGEYSSAYYWEE